MEKFLKFFDGKKTYIVAIVTGLLAAWVSLGHTVPEWVWAALGAVGLGTLRASVPPKQ